MSILTRIPRRLVLPLAVVVMVAVAGLILTIANSQSSRLSAASTDSWITNPTSPPPVSADNNSIPSPSPDSEDTTVPPRVDVAELDLLPMDLDYEALAIMSAYYDISPGDAGTELRDEVLANASAEVKAVFAEHWESKEELVRAYPEGEVFIEPLDISDVPSSEGDVTIAIMADVYQMNMQEPISKIAKVRWKVSFDITNEPNSEPQWAISAVSLRTIN